MAPPRARVLAPDGRRCPRPARPVTAFGGLSPPVVSAWLSPGFHRFCRRRWIRNVHALPAREARLAADPRSAVAVSPALPSRTGVSRASTGVPSYSRTPLTRGPVVGLFLSPPRRRHTGPMRFSFETWASTPFRVYRRRPPSRPSRLSPIRNGTSVCSCARRG